MPVLPKRKVGLISCSGEELPCGTVSRMATLKVLEVLRPDDTVTLCLPLFLAGNDKERAFARFYPTIAIDGCDKRCAARATEKYSAKPAASIVIPEFIAERHLDTPRTRRKLDAAGEAAADTLAAEIAREVDDILGYSHKTAAEETAAGSAGTAAATCSCGSGVPVTRVNVAGRNVEVVALPVIFEQARRGHMEADALFEAVKVYNAIPPDSEPAYRAAIMRAYAELCEEPP